MVNRNSDSKKTGKLIQDIQKLKKLTTRESIKSLIKIALKSRGKREEVLQELNKTIKKHEHVLYKGDPKGLKAGQRQKYNTMVRSSTIVQAAVEAVLGITGPEELLDNPGWYRLIDNSGMLERLGRWEDHIRTMRQRASEAARAFRKKYPSARIEKVKIFGLGGSAAPHDIARGIIDCYQRSGVEIEMLRSDTPNPDYIDKNTLVVLASFSGNTEETINSYEVIKHKAKLFAAIAKGGKLAGIADQNDIPLIQLPNNEDHPAYVLQPRESVCLQLTAILTFLASIGLKAGGNGRYSRSDIDFKRISELIRKWRNRFGPHQPFKRNPAKQLAFFVLFGIKYKGGKPRQKFEPWSKRIPYIIGDLNLRALVHEVATQFRERSKLNVAEGITPEDLHNTVESIRARIESAQAGVDDDPYVYMFIDSPDSERRIDFRVKKTRELIMGRKARYAVLTAEGDTSFERALFLTYFNAHMTTYAALLNGFDPLPVPTMSWMKEVMKGYKRGSKQETEVINKRQNSLQICEK